MGENKLEVRGAFASPVKTQMLNTSSKIATGSFLNDEQLMNDPCFGNFVNMNTIQYIKDQFH